MKKMNGKQIRKFITDIFLMIIGATLTTVATKYVYDPAGLVTGGVSGMSIIVRSVSARYFGYEIPLWMSNLFLNIPIFLYAMKVSGIHSVLRTGFVWVLMTAELFFFPEVPYVPENLLLVAIYGSLLMGTGSGLLLVAHATSGGSDMLGESLHHHIRSVSVGRLIQIIDGIVVAAGLITFGIEHTLYALISVYIMGKVVDLVIDRGKKAKMATIISDASDMIAKEIMTGLNRGVTGLRGNGMYTGADKRVLMCICSKKELVDVKDIVKRIDPGAFLVVGDVTEALGEGFFEEWE
ncbi:MAG: YitT family protein [Lachnospiraceae bacterium]|nr:YitT family protein [Lachnospiraceae bacterium]